MDILEIYLLRSRVLDSALVDIQRWNAWVAPSMQVASCSSIPSVPLNIALKINYCICCCWGCCRSKMGWDGSRAGLIYYSNNPAWRSIVQSKTWIQTRLCPCPSLLFRSSRFFYCCFTLPSTHRTSCSSLCSLSVSSFSNCLSLKHLM